MAEESPKPGKYVMDGADSWRRPNDDGTATYVRRGDHVYLTGAEAAMSTGLRPAFTPYNEKEHGEWDPVNEDPNAAPRQQTKSTASASEGQSSKS